MVELILNELHGLKSESWLLDGEFVPQSFEDRYIILV